MDAQPNARSWDGWKGVARRPSIRPENRRFLKRMGGMRAPRGRGSRRSQPPVGGVFSGQSPSVATHLSLTLTFLPPLPTILVMRTWSLQSGDPLSLHLAADVRRGAVHPFRDFVWQLDLAGGDPPALSRRTGFGQPGREVRFFPVPAPRRRGGWTRTSSSLARSCAPSTPPSSGSNANPRPQVAPRAKMAHQIRDAG